MRRLSGCGARRIAGSTAASATSGPWRGLRAYIARSIAKWVSETHPCLIPVAVRVGAVDGRWLPRTARAIGHLIAQGTSREAAVTSRELCRLPYSRSTFERVGHAVGRQYLRRREPVENTLIERLRVPDEARSISVSVDRTAVPMEEPVPARPPSVSAKLAAWRCFRTPRRIGARCTHAGHAPRARAAGQGGASEGRPQLPNGVLRDRHASRPGGQGTSHDSLRTHAADSRAASNRSPIGR